MMFGYFKISYENYQCKICKIKFRLNRHSLLKSKRLLGKNWPKEKIPLLIMDKEKVDFEFTFISCNLSFLKPV